MEGKLAVRSGAEEAEERTDVVRDQKDAKPDAPVELKTTVPGTTVPVNTPVPNPVPFVSSYEWETCLAMWKAIAPLDAPPDARVMVVRQNEVCEDITRAWWWRVQQHHGNIRKMMGGRLSDQEEALLASILLEKIPLKLLGVDNKRDTGSLVMTVPHLVRRVGFVSPGGKYLGVSVLEEPGFQASG
eukprot:Selendium_serpulae@DN5079_c0_g1_i1.p1